MSFLFFEGLGDVTCRGFGFVFSIFFVVVLSKFLLFVVIITLNLNQSYCFFFLAIIFIFLNNIMRLDS